MQYLFQTPIPLPWFFADLLTVLLSLVVVLFAVRRSLHPAMVLLECFAFVFLYAGLFENFAVVQGWYVYGRSLLMFGNVPLSVPLLEMDVFITGLWLLERMDVPGWCKPLILGLFGMLQDFSLDPLAVRQVYTAGGVTSGRWTWLISPGMANIYRIPVYNFPGWMLIMLYGSIYILLGRKIFQRSGFKSWVGYAYPFLAMVLALITMVTPLSQFLLWLAPFGAKGSIAEWIMLAFFLALPTILLLFVWRGKMNHAFVLSVDWPLFAVPVVFHIADCFWAITGGFHGVLWLILLSSILHLGLLLWIFLQGRKPGTRQPEFIPYSP
jgi:hypothetical protein